ncbi:hypothetical protein JD276_10000 [Leucobacter sp. CSA1]|uniref:Uncharacterized protein n=1 Tax=Leucobacter chromiisoli TaxID=2796471 RepID=A0A934Q9R0_9MICO|nr:hypothetical protein [Leucobacter chromiisoli]MBK0419367.1 hypothetical protein [Leucobacter chromiisoli]
MAKQQTQELFEESSQGAVSAVTAIFFILSFVLMVGGCVLMSYGVDATIGASAEQLRFAGGLAAVVIGFVLPFTLLPATGK